MERNRVRRRISAASSGFRFEEEECELVDRNSISSICASEEDLNRCMEASGRIRLEPTAREINWIGCTRRIIVVQSWSCNLKKDIMVDEIHIHMVHGMVFMVETRNGKGGSASYSHSEKTRSQGLAGAPSGFLYFCVAFVRSALAAGRTTDERRPNGDFRLQRHKRAEARYFF
jgi:hypothetical protein